MSDRLELQLRQLAAELDLPATPDIAARVGARMREEPRPVRRRRRLAWLQPRLAPVAAVLLVLVAGVAAVEPARTAVLELLGLKGAKIERVPRLPRVGPGADLGLGTRVTLQQARDAVRFAVVVPAELGEPDAVYLSRDVPGGQVSFVYSQVEGVAKAAGTSAAVVMSQAIGDWQPFIEKLIDPSTRPRRVRVDGEPGIYLPDSHGFVYVDATGQPREETRRIAGRVLLWQRGRVLLRLEGELPLERALAIAGSVR